MISIIFVLGMSELVFRLQRDPTSRKPGIIELVIPEGTGDSIANGDEIDAFSDELVFIVGDTLLVVNQDIIAHSLGPVWVPAKSQASVKLDTSEEYSYSCSFTPSQYLGLTVREPVTWQSRLKVLWYGVPSTLMFLLVYSFAVRPINTEVS